MCTCDLVGSQHGRRRLRTPGIVKRRRRLLYAVLVDLYDWLLFLHIFSAFIVVSAVTALWALVLATRPGAPVLPPEDAKRFGRFAVPMVGVGMVGLLIFGIWLAIDVDAYDLWDGWILASLILWLLSGWSGARSGQAFEASGTSRRTEGIRLQTVNTVAILAVLVLMIWKPGA